MTINISGTARFLDSAPLANAAFVFMRNPAALVPDGASFYVPEPLTVVSNGAALLSFDIEPGPYIGRVMTAAGEVAFGFNVATSPASQTFSECLEAIDFEAFSAMEVALLSVGLVFWKTPATGNSALAGESGEYYVSQVGGVLKMYSRNIAGSPVLIGDLFPASPFPAGTVAAPGLPVSGDTDTGFYAPAANELAAGRGGAMAWRASAAGLEVPGPLFGTAVTQTAQDSTTARLLKVGDGGINQVTGVNYLADIDSATIPQGLWQTQDPATAGTFPAGANEYGHLLNFRVGAAEVWQVFKSIVGTRIYHRSYTAAAWTAWREIFHAGSILGTVSQSAGVPTGRVIERGTNGNGEFVRFADGTLICTRTNLSAANASTALGSVFRSADVAWTFPSAFIAAPAVSGDVDDADSWLTTSGAPSTTAVNVRAVAAVTKAGALTLRATAIGRWF